MIGINLGKLFNPTQQGGGNTTSIPRRNLVINPSFEVDLNGWANDADYSRVTSNAFSGTGSVEQVSTTGFLNFYQSTAIPVVRNTNYVLSFYYELTINSGLGTHVQVNAPGAFDTNIVEQQLMASASWMRQVVPFNSGANDTVAIRFFNNNSSVVAFYDAFQVELGTVPTLYFDGSLPGCSWEGTPNLSVSVSS